MGENTSYKYFAFISYNSHDQKWGERVQKKLEHYKMPALLCQQKGWARRPLKPIFFAPTDIQPGGLTQELQERLRASCHLIVICSPHSAQSKWVGNEISYFYKVLQRGSNIHFFIVDGVPHSGDEATECFHPVVSELGIPEILGANVHEQVYRWPWLNRERAYVQLITKLLGVELDSVWQRHKRQLVKRCVSWAVGLLLMLATLIGVWVTNQPVDVSVQLKESSAHNDNLPPLHDAVVTMTFANEIKTDTLHNFDVPRLFTNVPHRFLGHEVRVQVACPDFLPVDTVMVLQKHLSLGMERDTSVYGHVSFRLMSYAQGKTVGHVALIIDGQQVESDEQGRVVLTVPLERQRQAYGVEASVPLLEDSIRMPLGPDNVLLMQ